ncbi:serine hydrolase [Microbacterium sp. SSM24]|uniref:serine hydrolase n=1 Tax=Microbacterium sp. SSM24 TaxID=2991714 RepID=UPI0022274C87|nr:serine hydrolase [Microbacterium sp. SSM24]MCW3493736.1 serine hydrolase [Microbacterium sp. SSM24]
MLRTIAWVAAFALVAPVLADGGDARAADDASDPGSVVAAATPSATPSPEPTTSPSPEPTVSPLPIPVAPDAETPEDTPEAPDEQPSESPVAPDALVQTDAALLAAVPSAGRVTGVDRWGTSVAASKAAFPSGARTVLVAEGGSTVDGIIAAGMAAGLDAPLLLVQSGAIPASVQAELRRLAPDRILVMGGETGVSRAVFTALGQFAGSVARVTGTDRYGTARLALASLGRSFDTVYVAGGTALIDAPLAFATASATARGALLVAGTTASADSATVAALRGVGARRVVIVGGPASVTVAYAASLQTAGFTVERRNGIDRYGTAILLAREVPAGASRAIVANSLSGPDTAVAAALAGAAKQPMLYAMEPCAPDSIAGHLAQAGLTVTGVGGTTWLSNDTLAGRSCSAVKAEREARLDSTIRSTMARYPGSYWVSVQEIGGLRQSVRIAGSTPKEPASMMKIYAAWAALKRVEQGRASLGMRLPSGVPLATCIHVMIHVSDNYCHTDIVHWIGLAEVNRMIRSAGFLNTHYGPVAPGVSVLYAGNRTTTNDLVRMMEKLNDGSVLGKKWADHLLREMGSQIGRSRIPSGIPPGVSQSSKPGALWVASGLMQNDTAIVRGPRATYAISIIGDNSPTKAAHVAISRAVYTHLNGAFGTAASYPIQQMVTKARTELRSSPGGPVVAVAGAGVLLEQLESERTWYQVQYGSRKLWVPYTALRDR